MSDAERTKWMLPLATANMFGGAAAGAFELPTNGSFEVTLKVSKEVLDSSNNLIFNETTAGSYGIFTYAGSGARYAPFETFTPISFASDEDVETPNPPVDEVAASGSSTPKLSKKFSREIAFKSGSSKLDSVSKTKIKNRIKDFRLASKVTITATAGMTSGASEKVVNSLAKKRANAIKKYLVAQGVASNKIVIKTKVAKAGKKPSTKVMATP
jgi:outer membrane protein OmpA-like peptidoglycan-associated protein